MNKPSYEVLSFPNDTSFLIRTFEEESFSAPYHFHPEYELTLIVKGKGKRFVGRHMDQYESGDLVLLGSDLPHCWKSDDTVPGQINARSVVIQFSNDFLGEQFLDKPELSRIRSLMINSRYGLKFSTAAAQSIAERLQTLIGVESNFKRMIQLLEILEDLAGVTYTKLNSDFSPISQSPIDQRRINPVFAYIVENFRSEVSMHEAASIASMSSNAFCKYFKKITRKTFLQVVFEYRINHAREELVNSNKPIHRICFDSGFSDLSQFHKVFRKSLHISPLVYRSKFHRINAADDPKS
jgi:AraC-like DNA-binding protein